MLIKRLKVKNFKSFKDLDIEIEDFNVLIGANASGKSNFVHIFRFLKDIVANGLDNAISMQGGVDYLINMKIGRSEDLYIKTILNQTFIWGPTRNKNHRKIYEIIYEFALDFNDNDNGRISEDRLTFKYMDTDNTKKNFVIFRNSDEKLDIDFSDEITLEEKEDTLLSILQSMVNNTKEPLDRRLIIEIPWVFLPSLSTVLNSFSIYDFDPKLPKKAVPITGKAKLEEDGSNLSIILNTILKDPDKKRMFFNLVNDLLPFIKALNVERFADKSLMFTMQESYFEDRSLPAAFISDGTINITGLILALYFNKDSLTIIEEPERNIHPSLISRVVDMMKDASRNRQVIVTTHNPELVRSADLESLLLIERDKDGFSNIYRPEDKEDIKTFLQNEIEIEDLYIQNLL